MASTPNVLTSQGRMGPDALIVTAGARTGREPNLDCDIFTA